MKKTTTSDRLKEIMEIKGLKQVDILNIVTASGGYISKSAISQYVNGKTEPDQEKLTMLAKALNVSETWLMGYELLNDQELVNIDNITPMPEINKKIPLLGTIAAGTPILAEENIEMYVELDKTVQADFCLKVRGDSMVNANIHDNDIVFIKKQPDVEDGEIAAVLIDDEATLKRVYKIGGVIQLRPENPQYKPITLDGKEDVMIIGKATYKLSKIY